MKFCITASRLSLPRSPDDAGPDGGGAPRLWGDCWTGLGGGPFVDEFEVAEGG